MNTLHPKAVAFAALLSATTFGACRMDPGSTDYASQQPSSFEQDEMGVDEFLPGPDPFVSGESRLVFGPFYEGASSEEIPVDDVNNFFFVFLAGGTPSLDVGESVDRIEGFQSNVFRLRGTSFWGMSVAWFTGNPDDGGTPRPEDLSMWTTLHISFKSSSTSFADVSIGLATSAEEGKVQASNYGYTNDGEWHTLEVPLADLTEDLSQVTTPLILTGPVGTAGEILLVDNFYYSAE